MSIHFGLLFAPREKISYNRDKSKFMKAGYLYYLDNTYKRGLSQQGLKNLTNQKLTARDLEIIQMVGSFKLLTTGQIQRLFFPDDQYSSKASSHRMCYYVLRRLTRDNILKRTHRQIGGITPGSDSYVYDLGAVGTRLVNKKPGTYYSDRISTLFLDHTIAIAEIFVRLIEFSKSNSVKIKTVQTEPSCHRVFMTGYAVKQVLKPDLHVRLVNLNTQREYSWFIELDRGTSHPRSIAEKAKIYEKYYHSGNELELFPRVLWIVPDEDRKHRLEMALKASNKCVQGLHKVVVNNQAISVITGNISENK